jgi:hypothetical protein
MHSLEPFYGWRNYYCSEDDPASPFFERVYSEFEYTNRLYNFYIHPQWDDIGSPTLLIKILYADYTENYCVIEFLGEWNDAIHNDIMTLKRDVLEILIGEGIDKYIFIGENVLNFHESDDCYYEELFDEVEDGWVAMVNFREHVIDEFSKANIDQYFVCGGELEDIAWRTEHPSSMYEKIKTYVKKRIG